MNSEQEHREYSQGVRGFELLLKYIDLERILRFAIYLSLLSAVIAVFLLFKRVLS